MNVFVPRLGICEQWWVLPWHSYFGFISIQAHCVYQQTKYYQV